VGGWGRRLLQAAGEARNSAVRCVRACVRVCLANCPRPLATLNFDLASNASQLFQDERRGVLVAAMVAKIGTLSHPFRGILELEVRMGIGVAKYII